VIERNKLVTFALPSPQRSSRRLGAGSRLLLPAAGSPPEPHELVVLGHAITPELRRNLLGMVNILRAAPHGTTDQMSPDHAADPSKAEVDGLSHRHGEGESIGALARRYEVHRTTVIGHLERAGIELRRVVRKMIDDSGSTHPPGAVTDTAQAVVTAAPTFLG